jgi:16S rRNA (guanine527-N7)-methyltransferase
MSETAARAWLRDRFGVSRETMLARYVALLVDEAARQNLVSASTLEQIWSRHIVDSAQLIPLAVDATDGPWLDIGSGAGLPGLVIALVDARPVILVEPRGLRVAFLERAIEALGVGDRVTIFHGKVETVRLATPAAIVTARAVMELGKLFAAAAPCTDSSTVWVLPKGRNAQSEVDAARRTWQGVFHVEPSITSPDSGIVIARKVRPR